MISCQEKLKNEKPRYKDTKAYVPQTKEPFSYQGRGIAHAIVPFSSNASIRPSRRFFKTFFEAGVRLNKKSLRVRSTMESLGELLVLSGEPPRYSLVRGANSCPPWITVFLDLREVQWVTAKRPG